MPARYAVFGNPIGHSKSPLIHAAFARQTGQDLVYEAILAPLDGFAGAMRAFRDAGGRGANVTVPFKEQAFQLCTQRSARAELAGAVNTLSFEGEAILGDNTDGIGLVTDIEHNLGFAIRGKRVLLMGAGGAARGVLLPLLQAGAAELVIANRSLDKAEALVAQGLRSTGLGTATPSLFAMPYATLSGPFDLLVNATAASLGGELPPLPAELFAPGALAYDMMYGRDTPFLAFARAHGTRTTDGLGMLVEQAAEAFHIWRGVRPETAPVIAGLRAS